MTLGVALVDVAFTAVAALVHVVLAVTAHGRLSLAVLASVVGSSGMMRLVMALAPGLTEVPPARIRGSLVFSGAEALARLAPFRRGRRLTGRGHPITLVLRTKGRAGTLGLRGVGRSSPGRFGAGAFLRATSAPRDADGTTGSAAT